MKKIIFTVFFILLLVSIATAGNYSTLTGYNLGEQKTFEDITYLSFDASEYDSAVTEITIYYINPNSRVDFVFTQWDNTDHSGYINYTKDALSGTYEIDIDGYSKTWTGAELPIALGGKQYFSTYGRDLDTNEKGLILSEVWIGDIFTFSPNAVFSPVSNIEQYPIKEIYFASTDQISIIIRYQELDTAIDYITEGADNSNFLTWIANLVSFIGEVIGIIWIFVDIFKFIFIDHFLEIITLYITITSAYCAGTSRDLMSFLKKWVGFQKKLIEALIGFIMAIINIFYMIINALIPF